MTAEFKVGDRVRGRSLGLLDGFTGTVGEIEEPYLYINWDEATPNAVARGGWMRIHFEHIKPEAQSDDTPRGVALARGDRQEAYGHPKDNFLVIADLWTAYLDGIKYDSTEDGTPLSPENVGAMMVLLKVARTINDKGNDSVDDIDGYAECIRMIREAEVNASL